LNCGVDVLGGLVEDQFGIGHVGIDQLIGTATVIKLTMVHVAVLVNMIVQGQFFFFKVFAFD
jgi:hypothetical protein